MDTDKIKAVQTALGVTADGIWGPKSQAALDQMVHGGDIEHNVLATSFADPADVEAFRRCKAQGRTDNDCYSVGDNGIGCWGDDTTRSQPMCALPPDDMIERWGSEAAAKHKMVVVTAHGKIVECVLADTMPWKKDITNGAGIDLNPAAVRALGFEPPLMTNASWRWL